jgi:uncharacterized protein DUF6186
MTRTVTLLGYALLAVIALAYQVAGLVLHRTATVGHALRSLMRFPAARPLLLAAWLWLGWHTFVRGSYQ